MARKAMASSVIKGASSISEAEEQLLECFKKWDADGSGSISKDEFEHAMQGLSTKLSKSQAEKLFLEADTNGDGIISLEEMHEFLFGAPHLANYFQVLMKLQDEMDVKTLQATKNDQGAAAMKDNEQWLESAYNMSLKPLIKKSFDNHDKHGNKILEVDESKVFFNNYSEKLLCFWDCMIESRMEFWLTKLGYLDTIGVMEFELLQATMETFTTEQRTCYLKSMDTCHNHAFDVLDKNKDGRLGLEEVIQGLTPGTYRYREFHRKLHLCTFQEFDEKFKFEIDKMGMVSKIRSSTRSTRSSKSNGAMSRQTSSTSANRASSRASSRAASTEGSRAPSRASSREGSRASNKANSRESSRGR